MDEKWVSHKDRLIQIAKEANMYYKETSENAIMIDNFLFSFDYEGKLIDIDER